MLETFSIDEVIRQIKMGEKSIEDISQYLPCHLHINSLQDFSLLEADRKIIQFFDLPLDEINQQGIGLLEETVHATDLENAIQLTGNYLQNKEELSHVSFLQRVKFKTISKEQLYYTRGKIIDENRILNISVPIQDLELYNHQVLNLYDNSFFIKLNIHKFNLLTKRELDICKYLCYGNSLAQNAIDLGISTHTIKNHKINIYKKLEVNNFFDFYNFCSKFKLTNS